MPARLFALREEHQHLLPHIEELRETAASVGNVPHAELVDRLSRAARFLEHHLIPHARAEDEVLYTVVAKLLGHSRATATMERDHVEVSRLTRELVELKDSVVDGGVEAIEDLKRVLYGLYAIVLLHFAKEEEVYVPLLEQELDQPSADELLRDMDSSHHRHDQ